MRGSSTSRVVPRPATFRMRARRGEGVHSTSSCTSERGVPVQIKHNVVLQCKITMFSSDTGL